MDYRKCFVPNCNNNSKNSPNKIFVRIREDLREKWCREVGVEYFKVYTMYCCEDHINPKEDLNNYYQHKLMNQEPRLKPTATLRCVASNLREESTEITKLLLQHSTIHKPIKRKYEDTIMPSSSSYSTLPVKNRRSRIDMEWKTDLIFQFLKLYQKEPTLWNTSSIEHKNRDDTYDAWNRIKRQLGTGDIPVKEIKRKRDNLMSTYRRLRSRVEKSKRATSNEAICEPDWPFYNFMANFLHDVYNPRKTSPSGLGPISVFNKEGSNVESDEEEYEETVTPSKKPLKRRKTKSPNNPKKLKEKESKSREINQELDQDECALYTTLLCKKLKALKESTREIAMLEIDRYIYNLKQQEKSEMQPVTPGLLQPMEQQYPRRYRLSPGSEYSSSQRSPEYSNVFPIKLSPSSEHNDEYE